MHLITGTWGDGGISRAELADDAELQTFDYYIERFIKDWQSAQSSSSASATVSSNQLASTSATAPPGPQAVASNTDDPEAVRAIQLSLHEAGYDVGAVDGKIGQRTRSAIRAYQRDHDLTPTGLANRALLEQILARRSNLLP
jgi:peptidoglycan hydrolase-like protein with peptidoglycan-binding domain